MHPLQPVRDYLADPDHWIKGSYKIEDSYCLFGAIVAFSSCTYENTMPLERAAMKRGYAAISAFNDAPETTHEDVLALLDEVITASE